LGRQTDGSDDVLQHFDSIMRLKARYCHLMDKKHWEEFATLFDGDATFRSIFPPTADDQEVSDRASRVSEGRGEIVQNVRSDLDGVISSHHANCADLHMTGNLTAEGRWSLFFLQNDGNVCGYGFYEDEFVCLPDGWHFRSITVDIRRLFTLPGQQVVPIPNF
jgi:hypothetical protein